MKLDDLERIGASLILACLSILSFVLIYVVLPFGATIGMIWLFFKYVI